MSTEARNIVGSVPGGQDVFPVANIAGDSAFHIIGQTTIQNPGNSYQFIRGVVGGTGPLTDFKIQVAAVGDAIQNDYFYGSDWASATLPLTFKSVSLNLVNIAADTIATGGIFYFEFLPSAYCQITYLGKASGATTVQLTVGY